MGAGGMPEGMSKGTILKKLDNRYSDVTINTLMMRKAALQTPGVDLCTAVQNMKDNNGQSVLTQKEIDHICDDWFNRKGTGWWKDIQPIEPILREGMIAAIDAALVDYNQNPPAPRKDPLPIVFYWMCHPGHQPDEDQEAPSPYDAAEVDVSWSDHQVTVVFHTPDSPPDRGPSPTVDEPIFVVKRDTKGGVVRVRPKHHP